MWGSCQNLACFEGFHVEGALCMSDHQTCFVGGKLGSLGWVSGAKTSCKVCEGGYTAYAGECYENWIVAKRFSSLLPRCWKDGVLACLSTPIEGYIGTPDRYAATSADAIQFEVRYAHAAAVNLTSDHVQIVGTGISGCTKSVSGAGIETRQVTISGCKGVGTLRISIGAGSASHASGAVLGAFGPSVDIAIVNAGSFPVVATTTSSFEYTGSKGRKIGYEISYPTDYQSRSALPVVIWVHGGGWTGGTYLDDTTIPRGLASLGFIVINSEYTLAPVSPTTYPGLTLPAVPYGVGPDDINVLSTFVRDNVKSLNGDPTKLSIAGGSAGGHLALLQASRADNIVNFKCVVDLAGPTDLYYAVSNSNGNYPFTSWTIKSIFGENSAVLKARSPSELMGTLKAEKLAIFHQLRDNLVPIEHALQLSQRTTALGKPLFHFYGDDPNSFIYRPTPEQLTHLFFDMPLVIQAQKAFLQAHCR